jgi:hypothetical protein
MGLLAAVRVGLAVRSWLARRLVRTSWWSTPTVVVGVTHLSTNLLGNIWDNLHTTRNNALRSAVAAGVVGCRWASKSFSQLLDKCASNVVCGNVHCIGNTKYNEGTLSRKRQGGLGCVQAGARLLLDFPNADARLSNDRSNEDVWDEEAERISLGLFCRRGVERLLIESANDETKCLCDRINRTADGENALYCTTGIFADGQFGTS